MFYLLTLILYIITLYLAKANMFYVGKLFFKYNTEIRKAVEVQLAQTLLYVAYLDLDIKLLGASEDQ